MKFLSKKKIMAGAEEDTELYLGRKGWIMGNPWAGKEEDRLAGDGPACLVLKNHFTFPDLCPL